jgi:hypothetical protein
LVPERTTCCNGKTEGGESLPVQNALWADFGLHDNFIRTRNASTDLYFWTLPMKISRDGLLQNL